MAVFAKGAQRVNLTIAVKDLDTVLNLSIPSRQVEQVFFILVQNALDSASVNKDQRLTISCHHGDEQVELRFSDTCGGIEEAKVQHIFEPFFTGAAAANTAGLSLTVAKQIVCDYGGDITAESQLGQGTILRVIFPMEPV